MLGSVLSSNNEREAARACYEEALAISREIGDQDGVASTMAELANLSRRQGDLNTARRLFDQVAEVEKEIGDTRDHPWRRYQLASLEIREGAYTAAGAHLRQALRAFQKTGYEKTGALSCLHALGCLAGSQRHWERMARLFGSEEAQRQVFQLPPETDWQDCYSRSMEAGRTALGAEVFTACWQEGRRMSWEQAVAFAEIGEMEEPHFAHK